MSIEIGSQIGPYEILSTVGAGGMGEVYRALDSRLDREVAIKVLPRRMAQDADARTRFEREAQAVAALTHPNILSIFDVGFLEDSPYYVTELLEGETLRSRLSSQPKIPWQKAVEIGIQLAEGLASAHNKKIIHRDLKPENVFLTSDGRIKILDFGLARVDRPSEVSEHSSAPTAISHTEPGTVLGTVGYMSPEQVRGLPADERSDIFSLGCLLYEMVTGSRAFTGETASDIMAAILRDEVRNASDSGVAVPFQMEWIIETCLKKDPQDRFQSARDLRAELRSVQGSGESLYFRPPRPSKSEPRRSAWPWMPVAAMLLVLLTAAVAWQVLDRSDSQQALSEQEVPQPIRSLAVLPFDIGAADPHVEHLSDEVAEGIINRLSGLQDLQIMAWSTVERYKDADPMQAGRDLRVDAVLTGRVSIKDEMVSVQTSLIDSRRGFQVWGERFEHPFLKAAEFQEQVARQIADRLGLDLPSAEGFEMAKWEADDPEAMKLYLQGRDYKRKQKEIERETRKLSPPPEPQPGQESEEAEQEDAQFEEQLIREELQQKAEIWQAQVESFQKALDIDQGFIMAQKNLAESLAEAGVSGIVAPEDVMPQAKEAAARLKQLNKSSEAAYVILGTVHSRFDRDWAKAGESLRSAVKMKPRSAAVRHRYAMDYLVPTGRLEEALEQMRRASKLKPENAALQTDLGRVLYYSRRYEEAIDLLEDVVDQTGGARPCHFLALSHLKAGDHDSGLEVLKDLMEDANDGDAHLTRAERRQTTALLGLAYGMAGETDKARHILARLRRTVQEWSTNWKLSTGRRIPPPPPGAIAPPRPPAPATQPGSITSETGRRPPRERGRPRRADYFRSVTFHPQSNWPYWLAHVHLGLGEHDQALHLLRKTVESRVGEVIYLKADPIFDPLRSDARFQKLLQMLNLDSS